VHIDRNDVFWMIPVRPSAVSVHFDDAHAELHVSNMSVFDDHDIANSLTQGLGFPNPPIPPIFPVHATVSFALATANIRNAAQRFEGSFLSTGATITWTADQAGFHFDSDNPADPAANLITVLGREQNGAFFT
jgi:hypothetical protein